MPKHSPHRPELRRFVRTYLTLVPPGRRATLEMVASGVNNMLRVEERRVTEDEARSILGWLIDRTEVSVKRNEELERDEYALN